MSDSSGKQIADLSSLDAPDDVRAAIAQLRDELIAAAGSNLSGLVIHGSLARGRFRPNQSDVNLAVLLREISTAALGKIAPALKTAWRAVRVEAMVLTPEEVPRLADVFPVKMQQIQAHHVLLYGDNPFHDLPIEREHLRLRTEQQLRNLELRLRRRYLAVAGDSLAMASILSDAARALAIDLSTVATLAGKQISSDDRTSELLASAGKSLELDHEALARIGALRRETKPGDNLPALYDRVLASIRRAITIVDKVDNL